MTNPDFESWADSLLDKLQKQGVAHTDSARKLLIMAMEAQTTDGPGASAERVSAWLGRFPLDGIATLYVTKYNARPFTFNRCIRLLSDLHELWIDVRMSDSRQRSSA